MTHVTYLTEFESNLLRTLRSALAAEDAAPDVLATLDGILVRVTPHARQCVAEKPEQMVHIVVWEADGEYNAQAYRTEEAARRDFGSFAYEDMALIASTVQS